MSSESPTCLPPWLPGQHISVNIKRWCLPQMHLSPQKTVLRDPAEGLTSQRTGPRGAAARVLTKRLKLLRNIASKAWGAELRSAGLSGKVPSTEHTAAWAAGAKRTGGRLPGHQPAACTVAALLGSARYPRPPLPPPSRSPAPPHSRPAPARASWGLSPGRSHLAGPGTAAPSLPQQPAEKATPKRGGGKVEEP